MLDKLRSIFTKNGQLGAVVPTNWAILVRFEGSDPTAFVEIRQNACAVWRARGVPFTSGASELTEFPNEAEAKAFLNQDVSANQADGFTLLHSGCTMPGHLDFDLLEEAVYNGAREAFQRISEKHPEEPLTGFALFTDFDGMTICPAAMTKTAFDELDEEADYYRTNPSEWPYSTDAGLLLAYRMILIASYGHCAIPFETEIPRYFERFFEACIRALERLDGEGLFESGEGRNDFLLLFGISDGGPTQATVKRLNPTSVYQRYAHCFDG